jgi:UDP-N-acetylglucosamine 1-carboxyvinyltransferase
MIEGAWRIVGGRPLQGRARPSGSKNGALPTLAACLLLEGETVLRNVPGIDDVATMIELLRAVGMEVTEAGGELRIANRGIRSDTAPPDLVGRMRASHYLIAPLLAQLGRAELPHPGGCQIGRRPMAHIIDVLEALGAHAEVDADTIALRSPRLAGGTVRLDPVYRSPGATFTALMAAATAEGATVVENASYEPDVVAFCRFLASAGARLEGIGEPTLTVHGVARLAGTEHRVNADRLEAGTLMCAAAATRGDVVVEHIALSELQGAAEKLAEAGIEIEEADGGVRAACPSRPRGVALVTAPYPGFPTDLQPPFTAVLACAEGQSEVGEGIFDRRLQCVEQLVKMGADMELLDSRRVRIRGVPRLRGAEVRGGNIRDAAAMVVAALSAEGESVVSGRQYAARGYQGFESKLRSLGAEITPAGEGES